MLKPIHLKKASVNIPFSTILEFPLLGDGLAFSKAVSVGRFIAVPKPRHILGADMLFDQPFLDSCREPFERYIGYHLDSEFYEL